MTTELFWGLLSTANINRALIPPLRSSKRNHLVAVASRDKKKAQAFAAQWHIEKAAGSYEELLADPRIDVIYNPLPNSLHAEWTVKALEAGKNVLCEKPLATSLEDVDAIIDAARKTGKVVAEAFMYRHHPQTLKAKEMVSSGEIGRILMIRGAFTFNLANTLDIRLDASLGGGSIWDVGCYPISYTRYLLGLEPTQVFGHMIESETGVDVSFSGQMNFPGESIAQVYSGFRSPEYARIEVFGEKGQILIPVPFKPGRKEKLFLVKEGEKKEIETSSGDLYEGEVEDIANAILDGKPTRISLMDSRNNVQTILNLLMSARSGTPVENR